jgi:phosphate transport system permease protein
MQSELEVRIETSQTASRIPLPPEQDQTLYKRPRLNEEIIRGFLLLCGVLSIFTTAGIVVVLGRESLLFFQSGLVTLSEFFTSTKWQPQGGEFGILPLLNATLMTSAAAMLVALPLGLGAAIYLSEYAPARVRSTLKPILEILAGVPTVVYGYFALTFMTPLLRSLFGQDTVQVYNTASAGLVMGIMILPTISSMSEDALSAVPRSLREASYGLGATRFETIIKVVVPAALSGIIAAFILGVSRAVGETMIVALASGAGPNLTFNPFVSAETMTGHIVRISGGDLSYNSIDYNSLFAIGLALFIMTLILNLISRAITARFREVYQ